MNEIFVNMGDKLNRWNLDDIIKVCSLVKSYATEHNLKDVVLQHVEDQRWEDPENQRFNVNIMYAAETGKLTGQYLLILKGEILDGNAFHKRFREFYPLKEEAS